MAQLTIYFLQASRSIRTVWLAEELGVSYEVKFSDREGGKAPLAFKEAANNPMGKFPTVHDGGMVLYESGAVTEYLCDKYDKSHRLIPQSHPDRFKVLMWVHAAEATFMLHCLAIVYANWNATEAMKANGDLEKQTTGMSANVQKAMHWLEAELGNTESKFLVGHHITAADIMMHFSAQFIMVKRLGIKGLRFPNIEAWLKACEESESYRAAVTKSGHTLSPAI